MKRTNLLLPLATLGIMGMLLGLSSCNPEKPVDQRKDKKHENPQQAVYTLIEGELSAEAFAGNPAIKDVKLKEETKQIIRFSDSKTKGWAVEDNSPNKQFKVKSSLSSPNTVYVLLVDYYSPSGAHMNNQFIDNGQDRIHQHFFSMYNKSKLLVRNPKSLPYGYRYADTTPWNEANGRLTGKENPIGFKGIINFTKDNVRFNLNIDLLHGFVPKDKFGLAPFWAPSGELRTNSDMDVAVKLPIYVGEASENLNMDANTPSPNPENPSKPDNPSTPGEATKALNKLNVKRIHMNFFMGHLHSMTSFHYVPGPTNIKSPYLKLEQEIDLEYQDGKWVTTAKSKGNKILAIESVLEASPYNKETKLPAPVYGCWIRYYNEADQEITDQIASGNNYQHFFIASNVKGILDDPLTGETENTQDLIKYIYRDTTPWDKSGDKDKNTKFNDAANPIGHKGFFHFPKSKRSFDMVIELWDVKNAKVDPNTGKASPYYQPSEHLRKHGEAVLRFSIPIYVPTSRKVIEKIPADVDEEDLPDFKIEELGALEQKALKYIMELLGLSWEEIKNDLYNRSWGERGDEGAGAWF